MSIQFNYFATELDVRDIADYIIRGIEDIHCIPERETIKLMKPIRVRRISQLFPSGAPRKLMLLPGVEKENIKLVQVPKGLVCVNYHVFPCIEYIPSFVNEEGVCEEGRLAYFYTGDDAFKKDVQRLYRRLKKQAIRLTDRTRSVYAFPDAAKLKEFSNWGKVFPNPLYDED